MGHVHIDPKLEDPALHLFWINRKNKNPANQVVEFNDLDSDEEAAIDERLNRTQGPDFNESQCARIQMELISRGARKRRPKKPTSRKVEEIKEELDVDNGIKEDPGVDEELTQLLQLEHASPEDLLNQTQNIFASQHFIEPVHRDCDPFSQSILEMDSENVAQNMKISQEEGDVYKNCEITKKEDDDLSARIESCQVGNKTSDSPEQIVSQDDAWDSEDEDDDFWNQPVEERDSDDLERILEDLEDKKEECESTDSERMSIDTTEEVVLEESKPSSTLRKRKHVKIKEEKRKRATFLESSVNILI